MRTYRLLLMSYPSAHRNEYGALMAQAFEDRVNAAGRGAALRQAAADTFVSAPREHAAAWAGHVRRQPGGAGLGVTLLVAVVGTVVGPTAGDGVLVALPLFGVMLALTLGVLRSFRESKVAVVGLGVGMLGLAVLAAAHLVPSFMEFADSTPVAIGIESALAGLALVAFSVGRASERRALLVGVGLSLPLGVGVGLYPILQGLGVPESAWNGGLFAAIALLAVALLRATPRRVPA